MYIYIYTYIYVYTVVHLCIHTCICIYIYIIIRRRPSIDELSNRRPKWPASCGVGGSPARSPLFREP